MTGIRLTIARKAGGTLSKRITLGDDGRPISDGTECRMTSGTARRVEIVSGASGLAKAIEGLDTREALILGDHVGTDDQIDLVKAAKAEPAKGRYGRTLDTFRFRPGVPAVVLLDFDQKGMLPAVAELIDAMGFEGAVSRLLKCDYTELARVIRASTSAGLYHTETDEKFPGSGGKHLYLLAKDGSDSPRFLADLLARAWLNGFGWIVVGKRGQKLVRSIVDSAVGSPERLVFEGPPLVMPPLAQDEEARRPIAHDGELIDTKLACPPLTDAERRQFEEMVAAAKAELEPESEAAVEKAAEKLAQDCSIPIERARAVITASTEGTLLSWDEVHFDDDALGIVSVADILSDPAMYHGETLADPLEGRSYGTGKARLYFNKGGDVRINSFVHGNGKWRLLHCPEFVALRIEEAGEKAPETLARLIPFMGAVDAVTRDRLKNLAANVGKVSRTAVREDLKRAQAKARAAEKEHRARNAPREGGKPRDVRQKLLLLGGERPAALREIEKALRLPANVKAGAVLARGQTQVVLRFAVDPVKLRGGAAEIELPAGSAYLTSAKPDHLQAQCDGLFAFAKVTKEGEAYAVDCPSDLARYALANGDLLPVMAISRTPVIRADGSVIEAPGYDPATGIIYAPDETFPPVPVKPTKVDAEAALKRLQRPFRGFPFVTSIDCDAVIAEVLTLLTRHLVPRAPAFVHNAIEAGSGKTKLFDTVATIAIGTAAPLLNAEVLRDETELRKLLTTLTLGAAPFAVFDNAPRGEQLTSPGLANYLTATVYGDRLLGANEEVKATTITTIGITGNGIEPAGDLTRRMLRIDLDAGCERPETRPFDFDSEAEARQGRGALVVAALTILKAHALAAWPAVEGRASLGSFEDWDQLVVGAIVFAGGGDIVKLMEKTRVIDPERANLAEVVAMLEGINANEKPGKKAGEIIAAVRAAHESRPFDEEAEEWWSLVKRLGKEGAPDPRRLGNYLHKNAGREVRGKTLLEEFDTHDKVWRYRAGQRPHDGDGADAGASCGVAGSCGVSSTPFLRKSGDTDATESSVKYSSNNNGSTQSPHNPATPQIEICAVCGERIPRSDAAIIRGDGSVAHGACYERHERERQKSRRPVF